MNPSRAGSNRPCSRIQRRRGRATSARFCSIAYRVFFKADVVTFEETQHRGAAASTVSEKAREGIDALEHVINCLGDIVVARELGALSSEPRDEVAELRRDVLAARGEALLRRQSIDFAFQHEHSVDLLDSFECD